MKGSQNIHLEVSLGNTGLTVSGTLEQLYPSDGISEASINRIIYSFELKCLFAEFTNLLGGKTTATTNHNCSVPSFISARASRSRIDSLNCPSSFSVHLHPETVNVCFFISPMQTTNSVHRATGTLLLYSLSQLGGGPLSHTCHMSMCAGKVQLSHPSARLGPAHRQTASPGQRGAGPRCLRERDTTRDTAGESNQ